MPCAASHVSRVAYPVARVLVELVLTPHLAGRTRTDLSLPRASRTPSRLFESALLTTTLSPRTPLTLIWHDWARPLLD